MDYDRLEKLKYQELKNIAKELNAPLSRNKEGLLVGIIQLFKEYENYKNKKKDKFTVHQQLGNKGKEGKVGAGDNCASVNLEDIAK